MDLLKRAELPAWLMERFGSASALAIALDVTRQTAHNLLTGRTIPSYETCEKLGLEPTFLMKDTEGLRDMSSLDHFLQQREQSRRQREANEATAQFISRHGAAKWDELKEATRATAARVGSIDGQQLVWDAHPFLKLESVAATFTSGAIATGTARAWRIIFGWIPTAIYSIEKNPLATQAWNVTLSLAGSELVWNVNNGEIVGAPSIKLAEQIIKQLIKYHDEYQEACSHLLGRT